MSLICNFVPAWFQARHEFLSLSSSFSLSFFGPPFWIFVEVSADNSLPDFRFPKEIWQSWILNSAPWILHSGLFVSGTWIPDSNYKWDAEYLPFIPDSTRKISQIPDSLTWGDSDPKINTFSVKLKPVNWASNYCRLSVHVVLVTICLKRGFVDQVK